MLPQERRLTAFLRLLAAAFGLAVFAYLLPALGLFGKPLQEFFVQLPFVTNSVVKIGTLALLAFFASADVRRFRVMVSMLIAAHAISEVAMIAVLVWGSVTPSMRSILFGAMALDGLILILLITFARAADRARHALEYFSPAQFRTLAALADVVVVGEDEKLSADDVARNTDQYLAAFNARSKILSKIALIAIEYLPLINFKPPLSYLPSDERVALLKKHFYHTRATFMQAGIRMAKQLCYLGYYGDERTHESIGYVPFSKRPDTPQKLAQMPNPPRRALRVLKPADIDAEVVNGDVVIIGSGAAASILAHNLIQAGREVLMLERGAHVDPTEFSENEVEMLGRLYRDGALQLSRDFRFQVLQGSCVGGTTVVNNAVCFTIPPEVLDRWNDQLKAGLDAKKLSDSFRRVEALIGVEKQAHPNLNQGAAVFQDGVSQLPVAVPPTESGVVDANIHNCLGCGYCNIGCRYGRKLSMLDTVLPLTQELLGGEGLRIISECEAMRLRGSGARISGVDCQLSDGRKLRVNGKTIIVAAGAVSSSLLLLRSRVGGGAVGRRVSFNMGSPVHALYDRKLNAYDGLQISHYLKPVPSRGYILETWYNPPVAQALVMPGWFENHFSNMRRYDRMSAVGVLVGTEPNAVVREAGLFRREIDFTPTHTDLQKLLSGIITAGEAFLMSGARAVMPATFDYIEYRNAAELAHIRVDVKKASDITLGTGHPMGGNALGGDSSTSVVSPEFKVHGYANLYVCDASVFPTAVGVNPQLTVMALADYASGFIGGRAVERPGDRAVEPEGVDAVEASGAQGPDRKEVVQT